MATGTGMVVYWERIALIVTSFAVLTFSNHDAKRLYDDLLLKSRYNSLIRPVGNASQKLTVKIGLKLSQLIKLDAKNQIMTTNVWVVHEWEDYSLRWNPYEYGMVESLYVPSEIIWLPDIVCYNNGDGDYSVTMFTKATLTYYGTVRWEPPAIYKSQCDIDVRYFPFDVQDCKIKFGIWTYDGLLVDIKHIDSDKYGLAEDDQIERGVDTNNYYKSSSWDLMRAVAKKSNIYYPCCEEPYPDVTFTLTFRRKTLFYTVNLMLPCISINLMTILAFFLPSDSGEKMSLCISLLLSLSLFQLLLMDLVPATSLTVPLLAKYITFTLFVVSISVVISVITLNVRFRSASTHAVPAFTRKVFLEILPKLLLMRRPVLDKNHHVVPMEPMPRALSELDLGLQRVESDFSTGYDNLQVLSTFIGSRSILGGTNMSSFCAACARREAMGHHSVQVKKALDGTVFIAQHLSDEDESNNDKADWIFLALVIDRLFLYIYLSMNILGTIGILLNAPALFDNSEPLKTPD